MADPIFTSIWQAIDACFRANTSPMTRAQVIAWVNANYADEQFKNPTLTKQLYRSCVNLEWVQKYEAPKILLFNHLTLEYSRFHRDIVLDSFQATQISEEYDAPGIVEAFEDRSDLLVGFEAQLRDYLAKNLNRLEPDLGFWTMTPPSVEWMIAGRRIDILAKDKDGCPVVLELKRGRAYDRVIGQALMYQALVAEQFGVDRVRIIIVASSIEKELRLAASRQVDVKLFEYELSMQLSEVSRVLQGDE